MGVELQVAVSMNRKARIEGPTIYVSVFVCLLPIIFAGCSTVETHTVQPALAGPYSGTKLAYQKAARSTRDFTLAGETWLYAFDVPLCIAADTLVLPYDIYHAVSEAP